MQPETTAPPPPTEMSAETRQRNTTQEITAMPRRLSQNMFEKTLIFGPSPTVTISVLELSPQLAVPVWVEGFKMLGSGFGFGA